MRAKGIPGVLGFTYTTWSNDYSQLESYGGGESRLRERLPLKLTPSRLLGRTRTTANRSRR